MDDYACQRLEALGVDSRCISERDLSECDLSGQNLIGLDLRGFTITKTNFEEADFTGSDLRELEFASANCVGAKFIGTDLRGARLAFGYFHSADFSGADLRGALINDSTCNQCTFAGADLRGASMGPEPYDSDFRGADLRGVNMPEDCNLERLNCDTRGALISPKRVTRAANKRTVKRTRLKYRVKVDLTDPPHHSGNMVDISPAGFKLLSPGPVKVGEEYGLEVTIPKSSSGGGSARLRARSAWCQEVGSGGQCYVGFRFEKTAAENTKIIDRLIRDNEGPAIPDLSMPDLPTNNA